VHLFAPRKRLVFAGIAIRTRHCAGISRRKKSSSGAIIDYYLASPAKGAGDTRDFRRTQPTRAEVCEHGQARASGKTAASIPFPCTGCARPQILSGAAGMHRFYFGTCTTRRRILWGMNFRISAIVHDTPKYPLGAWALPGKYTVKLTVDGRAILSCSSRRWTRASKLRLRIFANSLKCRAVPSRNE